MNLIPFRCYTCNCTDERIAGVDDNHALCLVCGDIMIRAENPDYTKYFPDWLRRGFYDSLQNRERS